MKHDLLGLGKAVNKSFDYYYELELEPENPIIKKNVMTYWTFFKTYEAYKVHPVLEPSPIGTLQAPSNRP